MRLINFVFVILIRIYQSFISPLLGPSCRHVPTCSEYCAQSIKKHGFFYGGLLGLKRILSCHPWSKAGYDPVPKK